MAAVKLYSEFKSDTNKYYKIEIWDEDYTGSSPDEFTVDGNGFILDYKGLTDNIYSPIIGSSVSFGMYVNDTATTTFLNTLKEYQQDRYYIKIYRGNSEVSTELYWAGYIIQDLLQIEDISEPYLLYVQCTDGLAKLKDVTCSTSWFRIFTKQFINALDAVGVLGIYDTDDPLLAVVCDWYAEEMTYSSTLNPLDETWADFRAFDTIDEDGTITGKSWYEVISQMCKVFGLRFYYSNGQYRLEQLFERASGTFTDHTYKKDKTKIQELSGLSYSKVLDQTSNKARLAGNVFNFLPAASSVDLSINKEAKAVIGVTRAPYNDPTTELGFITSANNNQLTITFSYQTSLTVFQNASVGTKFYYKFKLNVVHFDPVNNVSYYLKRTYTNLTPSAATWTNTQSGSGYEILIGPFEEVQRPLAPSSPSGIPDFYEINGTIVVKTPTIPINGTTEFEWDFVEYLNTDGTTRSIDSENSVDYKLITQNVQSRFGDIVNQDLTVRCNNTNNKIQSSITYGLGTLSLFTGSGERGSLVEQSTLGGLNIRVPYGNWRKGNSGSYIEIQKLICQEFLKLMDEPIEMYQGTIFSNHEFRRRLTFDSNKWVQISGKLNANLDQWEGDWFSINSTAITSTFDDTTLPTLLTTGAGGNSLTNGPSLDSFSTVNLEVDAASTLNGPMTNNGAVITAVNSIAGTAGGSEEISNANYMNHISYSGGNGNYTINLPAASTGVFLRFKTNETIAANKTITISANGSETIDGEDDYVMDRPYDGISLIGNGSSWFIIQKKEK